MPFMRKIPPELEFAGIFFGQKMCAPGWDPGGGGGGPRAARGRGGGAPAARNSGAGIG